MITPIQRIPVLNNEKRDRSLQQVIDQLNEYLVLDGQSPVSLSELEKNPVPLPKFLYNSKGNIV